MRTTPNSLPFPDWPMMATLASIILAWSEEAIGCPAPTDTAHTRQGGLTIARAKPRQTIKARDRPALA